MLLAVSHLHVYDKVGYMYSLTI